MSKSRLHDFIFVVLFTLMPRSGSERRQLHQPDPTEGTRRVWLLNSGWLMLFHNGLFAPLFHLSHHDPPLLSMEQELPRQEEQSKHVEVEKYTENTLRSCPPLRWDLRVRISFTWVNKAHWVNSNPYYRWFTAINYKINDFWSPLRLQTDTNDLFMMNLVYYLTSELYWQTCWWSVTDVVLQWWLVRNGSIWLDSRQGFVKRKKKSIYTHIQVDQSVHFLLVSVL